MCSSDLAQFIGNPPMNIMDGTYSTAASTPSVTMGSLVVPLPEAKPELSDGAPVIVGIRPDAIKVGEAVNRVPEQWRFEGEVVVAEILGGQTHLEYDIGGNSMIAEVEGRVMGKPGETMTIGFEPDRIILFDPETTNSLL